jgi:hypothetical protein
MLRTKYAIIDFLRVDGVFVRVPVFCGRVLIGAYLLVSYMPLAHTGLTSAGALAGTVQCKEYSLSPVIVDARRLLVRDLAILTLWPT